MKKIFGILICMLLIGTCFVVNLGTVSAEDLVEGDYIYTVSNGEATITGYTGTGGAITIPSALGGYPTITIGDSAFYQISSLASVTIPNSVTTIQNAAFEYCNSLTSIIIPNNVWQIGTSAFAWCTSLTSVTIGSRVTNIGDTAFAFSSSLTSITFLGLIAPTVGMSCYSGTPAELRGHAYANSNFPAPGEVFVGLTMGDYIGEENELPVAVFTWTPSSPKANQTVTFDASTSSDTDGSISKYEWDWNNDGTYDDSKTTPTVAHSWTQAGSYTVKLKVTDNGGATSTKTMTVTVGSEDQAPGTTEPKTPGFELIFLLCAIGVSILLWKKKRNK